MTKKDATASTVITGSSGGYVADKFSDKYNSVMRLYAYNTRLLSRQLTRSLAAVALCTTYPRPFTCLFII